MFTKSEIELFNTVCQLNGVSGREYQISHFLKEEFIALGMEIIYDNLGSIYAVKKSKTPNAPKVMLDGHMDEIGFIVTEIMPNGCLKVAPIGGINPKILATDRINLIKRNGEVIEGTFDNFIHDETDIRSYLADFGFISREDALENGVNYNDMIIMKGELVVLNGGKRMLSKAFDDRYGICLGLEILKEFKDKELPFDLYVGGSVQEEVGLRGSITACNMIQPDLAIVLDCSAARDLNNEAGRLGEGVLIRYFDSAMVAFPELLDLQIEACKKANVKYQYFETGGGTNAGRIHVSNNGVLTLTHCICGRNIHSASTIIDSTDYHSAKASLIELLKMIDVKKIEDLKGCKRQ